MRPHDWHEEAALLFSLLKDEYGYDYEAIREAVHHPEVRMHGTPESGFRVATEDDYVDDLRECLSHMRNRPYGL